MNTKRLFLFAGYDKSGIIDDALVYYIKSLSKFGDVVLFMDSDCTDSELKKLQNYTVHICGTRHGEYDFGSYKRAYIWASENLNISQYDFVYLANDSVYGPLYDLSRYFHAMETMGHDAFGMVKNPHHSHPHIQSWFVGLTPKIYTSPWFDKFMCDIKKLPSKGEITRRYEQGLTKLVIKHKLTWDCLYTAPGRSVYNKIRHFYRIGMPFMKKVAFTRNHGALGGQILYVLNKLSPQLRTYILSSAYQSYGHKYIDKLLTHNPIKIAFRNIHHVLYKLFIEGI